MKYLSSNVWRRARHAASCNRCPASQQHAALRHGHQWLAYILGVRRVVHIGAGRFGGATSDVVVRIVAAVGEAPAAEASVALAASQRHATIDCAAARSLSKQEAQQEAPESMSSGSCSGKEDAMGLAYSR